MIMKKKKSKKQAFKEKGENLLKSSAPPKSMHEFLSETEQDIAENQSPKTGRPKNVERHNPTIPQKHTPSNVETHNSMNPHDSDKVSLSRLHLEINQDLFEKLLLTIARRRSKLKTNPELRIEGVTQRRIVENALRMYFEKHDN